MMFLDKNENKNQSINFNLSKFPNWRNVKNPDLANALTIGGATFLGSAGLSSINTAIKQKKGKKSVYEQYIENQGGQDFIDRCSTGNCPGITYYNPDQEWFYNAANRAGDQWENHGYWMGSASQGTSNDFSAYRAVKRGEEEGTILSKEDLNKKYLQNIKKGIKHGVVAGGTSYLLNKALDNTRWGRKLQNKLGMDINLGIYRKKGGEKYRGGGIKKYATAGMYTNAIPSALTNSTTNIVGAERDPSVLQQNQANINAVAENLRTKNENLQADLTNLENTKKEQIQTAADNMEGKFTAAEGTLSKGLNFADKQGWLEGLKSGSSAAGTGTTAGGLGNISLIDKSSSSLFKPLNLPSSPGLPSGITPPSSLSTGLDLSGSSLLNPTTTTPGSNLLGTGTDLLSGSLSTGSDAVSKFAGFGKQGMEFSKLAQAGKLGKLGAGAGKFLTSGAGLGTIASLAGQGIKKLSDDNKAHVSNTGEYAGSILSAAGTGASIGSIIPGVGTAIGAGIGALYGAGKQFFGTQAAKRKKEELDAQKRIKQLEYNEQLEDQMGTQLAGARMGEMEQKTYSGYDLGRNVTYAFGGGRMEMPRYY